MNPIIKFLKESQKVLFARILNEAVYEALLASKHLSGTNQSKDCKKLITPITVTTHALEKGMAIGKVRAGFGKDKAMSILNLLDLYIKANGEMSFVNETCSVIKKYLQFNIDLGADMSNVEATFENFCKTYSVTLEEKGGIYIKELSETRRASLLPFNEFSQSRFSVRDFGNNPIDPEAVRRALKICEKTPSACNRQRWHIYVFESENVKNKMFALQGGAKGFYEDMQTAILICGDIRGYGMHELHQAYVDGGIYAMNLLYALHYEGLAAIPLTMGHKLKVTKRIKAEIGIPEYEIPIVLVGVGTYKNVYKVAVSERRNYTEYCTFK